MDVICDLYSGSPFPQIAVQNSDPIRWVMRPTRLRTMAWARIGASVMLLLIVLCAPSTSRADCRHPGDRPAIGLGIDAFWSDAQSTDLGSPSKSKPKPC